MRRNSSQLTSALPNGLRLQLRASSALRGPTEAPSVRCQTLPEADWNALWLVSCNRLFRRRSARVALRTRYKYLPLLSILWGEHQADDAFIPHLT